MHSSRHYYRSLATGDPAPVPAHPAYLDVIFIGGGIILTAWLTGFLYCSGKKGTEFCNFPCEPFFGICENKRLRRVQSK